ncbi:MAG: 6-bladed beta-propeller [Candidatus Omnitrophota bacterium]
MKFKHLFLTFFIFTLFSYTQLFSANVNQGQWKETVKNGVKTIINTGNPIYGKIVLGLEKNLSLSFSENDSDIFGDITTIDLDKENNIYVLDGKRYTISVFDNKGRFLYKMGGKGAGPGEFRSPVDFFVGLKKEIYVLDDFLWIHILDMKGKYISQIRLNNSANAFNVYKDRDYLISFLFYSQNKKRRYIKLNYMYPLRNINKEIAMYEDGEVTSRVANGKFTSFILTHYYTPGFFLTRMPEEKSIYGFSSEYALTILGKNGAAVLRIEKTEEPVSISGDEKDRIYQQYSSLEKKWSKNVLREALQFADHRPFFKNILVDDLGRIYVERMDSVLNEKNKNKYMLDVFDKYGHYIYRMEVPVKPVLIRNGFLYSIDNGSESDDVSLQRFRVLNWANMRVN